MTEQKNLICSPSRRVRIMYKFYKSDSPIVWIPVFVLNNLYSSHLYNSRSNAESSWGKVQNYYDVKYVTKFVGMYINIVIFMGNGC